MKLLWFVAARKAIRREESGGFAGIPFDGVQAVAAVGQVGDAEVFRGGQDIADAFGDDAPMEMRNGAVGM